MEDVHSARAQDGTPRYVPIQLAAAFLGLPISALRTKMASNVWIAGREYLHDPDGRRVFDLQVCGRWPERGMRPPVPPDQSEES